MIRMKFSDEGEKVVDKLARTDLRTHGQTGYWQNGSMEAGAHFRLYSKGYLEKVYVERTHPLPLMRIQKLDSWFDQAPSIYFACHWEHLTPRASPSVERNELALFSEGPGAEFLCGTLFDKSQMNVGLSTLSLQAEKPDLYRVPNDCSLPNAWILVL